MEDFDRLAVMKLSSPDFEERVTGPTFGRDGFERLHAVLNVLLRDDGSANAGVGELAGEEGANHAGIKSGGAHLHVTARVVAAKAGVHDELNRLLADFADGGDYLIGELPGASIHDQCSLVAYLHGDVAAIAREHIDISLNGQYMNLAIV